MVIGTGADYSILAQISTLAFIYLAIKFVVWNKIFEYMTSIFKNKYTFAFFLIAIIFAIIDNTLWNVYFDWLTFLIQSIKTAV